MLLRLRARSLVRAGADYSYGIYLSQVLFLSALTTSGWQNLGHHLPWPLVTSAASASSSWRRAC